MSNETNTDPNASIIEFLDSILDNDTLHPSLRTMAAQVIMTYNKKFGASSIESNKVYLAKLREIVLSDFKVPALMSSGSNNTASLMAKESEDKILEARINAAFQVLK